MPRRATNIRATTQGDTRTQLQGQQFLATVASISGNKVGITRAGQSTADPVLYPTLNGPISGLAVGNVVAVHRYGASFVVTGKVTT